MGVQNSLTAKGFFTLEIVNPDGTIAGRAERVPNVVTRHGFNHICLLTGTSLSGTQFSHGNVGEGAAPATNATSLPSEVSGTNNAVQRQGLTAATQDSVTLRFTFTMSSANSFVTATENISNVGLFNHSSGSSCVAGAAYTSSSCASNQNVNVTYDLVFETA